MHKSALFPGGSDSKDSTCNAEDLSSISRSGRSPEKGWLPTPVFLPEEFHEQRSLVGYSPWGLKELDTAERLIPSLSLFTRKAGCENTFLVFTHKLRNPWKFPMPPTGKSSQSWLVPTQLKWISKQQTLPLRGTPTLVVNIGG